MLIRINLSMGGAWYGHVEAGPDDTLLNDSLEDALEVALEAARRLSEELENLPPRTRQRVSEPASEECPGDIRKPLNTAGREMLAYLTANPEVAPKEAGASALKAESTLRWLVKNKYLRYSDSRWIVL